jgi:hypothetical protein
MTKVDNQHYQLWDARHAGYILGPGWLYFRINEKDGPCLDNNYGQMDIDLSAPWLK